ncbi:MAG: dihydrodipicolinate synthase family protein [Inquilinaceae bacterium]
MFPVIATPFRADGSIDIDDFHAIIDFVVACGADGMVFPGMASEVETLTGEERANLVALLGRRLDGRRPFVVGASHGAPAMAIARAEEGRAAGAVAAMIMAPPDRGRDTDAQIAFFREVGTGTALEIMIQNAPPPNGAGLPPEIVVAVAEAVPTVTCVKEETPPCGQHLSRIRAAMDRPGRTLTLFGGAGGRYITDELARGAAGTMPASELADVHVALVRAWRAGDEEEARRIFERSLPLLNFQAVFRTAMTKDVLRRRGIIRNADIRTDGHRLDHGDMAELAVLLARADAAGLFTSHLPRDVAA